MLKQLRNRFFVDGFSASFVAVTITQVVGMLLGYSVSIYLSNLLSESDFGLWSYLFQSIIPIAMVLVLYGNHNFIVRELTQLLASNNVLGATKVFKQSLFWSTLMLLIVSICFLGGFRLFFEAGQLPILGGVVFLVILFLWVVARLRQSYQQVIGYSSISQIPERVVFPLLFILAIWIWRIQSNESLNVFHALVLYSISIAIAVSLGFIKLKSLRDITVQNTKVAEVDKNDLKTRKYFFLLSLVDIVDTNIDLILLKELVGFEEIAYFSVAKRISFLLNMILYSTNYTLFPMASSLYAQGKKALVQAQILRIVKINAVIATVGVAILFLLKDWLLGFFGASYQSEISWAVYGTLVLVQWVNILLGVPSLVMNVAGKEKHSLIVFTGAILLQVSLSVILVPALGIEGMAYTHLINTLAWNLALGYMAKKHTGLKVSFIYP